ncbi:hypothetical protein [Nevskia ramosa]|uniref:hypothetical protein n=1 Tax=Nevskia ramosa TaxID=64002 RepID=UPI003D0D62D1
MDFLPPELSEFEAAALEALALRKALPASLTPGQLVVLAYPDAGASRDRRRLLHAICAALDAGELTPAIKSKTLADLHPAIAARWQGEKPPFNPAASAVPLFIPHKSEEALERESSHPEPNFNVPISREDFLAWSRGLGLSLPGYAVLRTNAPDDHDKRRAHSIEVLAELGRLPAWLTRGEIFRLWYPHDLLKGCRAMKDKRAAHDVLFLEGVKNGALQCCRLETKHAAPADSSQHDSWNGDDLDFFLESSPVWYSPAPVANPAASVRFLIWVHRDDMAAWLHLRKITLPEGLPLHRWWPDRSADPGRFEQKPKQSDGGGPKRGGRPKQIKAEPLDALRARIENERAAGGKPNISAHCRAVAKQFGISERSLRKLHYD